MANIIIPNEQRKRETEHVARQFGADMKDPAMREAAEISAVRTREAIESSRDRRRYY